MAWVIGMLAISVNTILYFSKGLYGQVTLEFIYMVSMFYGLYLWSSGQKDNESIGRPISRLTWTHGTTLALLNVIGIVAAYWMLAEYLGSTVPLQDALILCLSLTAQWLLCRKVFECWIVWFVVDAIVAWVHAQKGIPFHSGVHFLYLFLAVVGYVKWLRLIKDEAASQALAVEEELVPSA
jgi:nicotinamide mononucleotide transporter